MNNEIAGYHLLDTHANNKVIYSTRRKHFVLCVGTALRCKGGEIAMSSISKNTAALPQRG